VIASQLGHADIVSLLLQHPNVDPTAQSNAPLFLAATAGNANVVARLLHDPRPDPTVFNCRPFISATANVCINPWNPVHPVNHPILQYLIVDLSYPPLLTYVQSV
jgi:hypothetical protein